MFYYWYKVKKQKFHLLLELIILIALFGCISTTLPVIPDMNEWHSFELRGSSNYFAVIKYPPFMKYVKRFGVDSYVGSFEGRGLSIHFDFGWCNGPLLESDRRYHDHIIECDTINGYPAQISTSTNKGKLFARAYYSGFEKPYSLLLSWVSHELC